MLQRRWFVFCCVIGLSSIASAIELGLAVGSDGTVSKLALIHEAPLCFTGTCGLKSGHFLFRMNAAYGLQRYQTTFWQNAYTRGSFDDLRIQAVPNVETALPMLPLYLAAGLGLGFHLDGTNLSSLFPSFDMVSDSSRTNARVRGFDATIVLTIGLRVSHALTFEFATERMIADWSSAENQMRDWENGSVVNYSTSSTKVLNWYGLPAPGYRLGVVWRG